MNEEWRDHPKLRGRFHSEYPDDLQVVIHEGDREYQRMDLSLCGCVSQASTAMCSVAVY